MAADDDKTTVVKPEGEGEETPKGKSNIIMLGGVGLGAIVIGVLLALFVLKPMMSDSSGDVSNETAEIAEDSHGEADNNDGGHGASEESDEGGHGSAAGKTAGSLIYAMNDIVVNPAGTGGSRFLSISLGFELGTSKLYSDFEDKAPVVRDALITILSSKTITQLTDSKQKEIVRYQIKKRVSDLMKTKDIKGVYYTNFVLQ